MAKTRFTGLYVGGPAVSTPAPDTNEVVFETAPKVGTAAAPAQYTETVHFVASANASVVDSAFFIADRPWRVIAVREIHAVAGTDVGAVSADVKKQTGTQGPAAGVTVLSAVIDLKGTANTVVDSGLTATAANLDLAAGDRLSADISGVTTAVAGLAISVDLIPI